MEISTREPSKPEPYDAKPKKARKKTAKGHRGRGPDNIPSFVTYFSRVLRQVRTCLSLSHEAVNVMDSFVKDMFELITEEDGCLAHSIKHHIITSEGVQTGVWLRLPGEIGKYAMSEATKSMISYNSYK